MMLSKQSFLSHRNIPTRIKKRSVMSKHRRMALRKNSGHSRKFSKHQKPALKSNRTEPTKTAFQFINYERPWHGLSRYDLMQYNTIFNILLYWWKKFNWIFSSILCPICFFDHHKRIFIPFFLCFFPDSLGLFKLRKDFWSFLFFPFRLMIFYLPCYPADFKW